MILDFLAGCGPAYERLSRALSDHPAIALLIVAAGWVLCSGEW